MIYITGDTHGHQDRFVAFNRYLKKGDILIILGDFGYLFKNNQAEHDFLDYLSTLPYTICFIDGNHENFSYLNQLPVTYWNGGKVHQLKSNIYHLIRGQIFTIDQKTFFTMGGAFSITRHMGIKNYNWWEDELPRHQDYDEAYFNLEKHHFHVDYILTHTCPKSVIYQMDQIPVKGDMTLIEFLELIEKITDYKHWYFGHFHIDQKIAKNIDCLLFKMIELETKKQYDTYE